jgi:LmbE family N-acetylglucosaminyl deacetylase
VPDDGTLLGVWAHPDDETYLSAGLMAASVQAGARVVCVTATRGEEGSFDEERWPSATMGAVREAELMASLDVLGVTEHHWLDYHDGSCADVPHAEGVARVSAVIEAVEPARVLTFGPDGMTGHDDHRSVCAWTTEAFHAVAPAGATLLYATQTPAWAAEFVDEMNRFNVFMEPGTPPVTPVAELAVDFELSPELLELKLAAIMEQVSQVEGMMQAFGPDFYRRAMKAEFFRSGATKPSGGVPA